MKKPRVPNPPLTLAEAAERLTVIMQRHLKSLPRTRLQSLLMDATHSKAKAMDRARKAERARVRRMVKALPRYDENKDYYENQQYLGLFKDGRFVKLDDLLTALKGRP